MEDNLFIGKTYDDLPTQGNVSPFIQNLIIKSVENKLSLFSLRFIALLSMNLKEKQLLPNGRDRQQLDLFDSMTDFSKDSGLTYDFSFKYSDFLPKGDKNYIHVKTAIEELQNSIHTISFSRANAQGKMIDYTMRSALITSFVTDNKQGFKISINAYWYRALTNLTTNYNKYLKNLIFDLSQNGFIFYFYLQTLPFIKEDEISEYMELVPSQYSLQPKILHGTRKKTTDLLQMMATNRGLTKKNHIEARVFEPLRQELQKYSDIGFNFKIDKGNTSLVVYPMEKTLAKANIIKSSPLKVKSSFSYQLQKAKLDYTYTLFLLELYSKYPYEVITKATGRKPQLIGLKGKDYIDAFLLLINAYVKDKVYLENSPEDREAIKKELLKIVNKETYKSKKTK